MKKLLLILPVVLGGCTSTDVGGVLSRKALFANLEFDHAHAMIYRLAPDGHTNSIEIWSIDGLKSDTQKALATIEKALDKIPQKP